jgi:2-phosphosulfolactate phosphatase
MKVEVVSLVEGAKRARGIALLIDVFRSSNTMLVLASRGSRIIQADTVDKALALKAEHPEHLLFGEEDGFPPEGFDHGNSPVEAAEVELTPTVILCTSAGSGAIYAMKEAEETLITSFANVTTIINHIAKSMPEFVTIVAVGKEGTEPATEDELCADFIHSALLGYDLEFEEVKQEILESPTAQRLRDRGQEDDLEFCLQKDIFDIIPTVEREDGRAVITCPGPSGTRN